MDYTKLVVDIAIAIVPIILGLVTKLLANVLKSQKNKQILSLASIAIHWAEDQVEKGKKLDAAAQKLVDLSKGKIKLEDAKILIAASYAQITGALEPIAGNA